MKKSGRRCPRQCCQGQRDWWQHPHPKPMPMCNGTTKARQQRSPALHCRSVLGGFPNPAEGTTRHVVWNSELDRVNTDDGKARTRPEQ